MDSRLNLLRAGDGPARACERKHRAVTLDLHDPAAVRADRLPDHVVVEAKGLHPGPVTEPRCQYRRIHDVGEDERHRAVAGGSFGEVGPIPLNRLLDLLEACRQLNAEHIDVRATPVTSGPARASS